MLQLLIRSGQALQTPPPSAAALPSMRVLLMCIDSFCRKPCWLEGSEESWAGPWMSTPPPSKKEPCRVCNLFMIGRFKGWISLEGPEESQAGPWMSTPPPNKTRWLCAEPCRKHDKSVLQVMADELYRLIARHRLTCSDSSAGLFSTNWQLSSSTGMLSPTGLSKPPSTSPPTYGAAGLRALRSTCILDSMMPWPLYLQVAEGHTLCNRWEQSRTHAEGTGADVHMRRVSLDRSQHQQACIGA
jgi:hypothetical protein